MREAEARRAPGRTELAEAVARNLFKLMAIKDEYEVARLWTDGSFRRQLEREFERWDGLEVHLAPPLLAERDAKGHLKKRRYGPWMLRVMRLLARLKGVRGTAFDLFGRTAERRMERRLLADYEALVDELSRAARYREPCHRGRTGAPPAADPRLRPRQGGECGSRRADLGGLAGALAHGLDTAAGGRIATQPRANARIRCWASPPR